MSNLMSGDYRATIVATNHPQGLMKAKIRLTPLWDDVPDAALPWAEYRLPIGNIFIPSLKGDKVWVRFPYNGDSRYPLITGAAQDAPNGVPNVAPEASGNGSPYQPPEVEGAPALPTLTATEDLVYARNNFIIIQSVGGGVSMTNTVTGSCIGMNEAGDVFQRATGDYFLNATGGIKMKCKGLFEFESETGVKGKSPDYDFSK
ncbi:MAG: baseplate protein [Plesiomonas sp.]|uniref:baseplate protein n=1 Tax=Plesiomonas sp. TaxID=2486279 RepID=UPI003F2FEBAB